ncbi:siderophore-interacting protein [Nonomuraea sp. NPDC050790]|uniref:siderophore-interacting protein n=1 Tax=Nonomuraea sp. NPDC050790 TaxID=3364371 RepID=UPI0037931234
MRIFRGEVSSVSRLSATMIRVTLALDEDFPTTGVGDEYVRLFFPHGDDRREVSLPEADGERWRTPEGRPAAPMRTYTVRAVRPRELDVDFVVHDGGIAARWALDAGPGDVLGLNSPTGLYDPPADLRWQVLVCDLTGLPAMARLISGTPPEVTTKVIAEIPGDDSRLDLPSLPNVEVTWLRGGNGAGPSRLDEAVRAAVPPSRPLDGGYVWVAGATDTLRGVRRYLRRERGLPAERYKVIGYWTPDGEAWAERFRALPADDLRRLEAIWEDTARDEEDLRDDYEAELERLGL